MSIHTLIKSNDYHDSVVLMAVSAQLRESEGISDALVVMGTDSNKDVLRDLGLLTGESAAAGAYDLIIAIKADNEAIGTSTLDGVEEFFRRQEPATGQEAVFSSLSSAFEAHRDANLALISVPGQYAAREAAKAIDLGLDTLLFSANVSLAEEAALKKAAAKKQVLLMGPDCGVCNIRGKALALASIVRRGPIGIVGASGSGLQEVSGIVDRHGLGISHAIGTGGRDMSDPVEAMTTVRGIRILDEDPSTQVIVVVAKRTSDRVTKKLRNVVRSCTKPVIVCCLGDSAGQWLETGALYATSMDDAARLAVGVIENRLSALSPFDDPDAEILARAEECRSRIRSGPRYVRGVYGAGTFVSQAQVILGHMGIPVYSNVPFAGGRPLENVTISRENTLVDLGDEELTLGRAHPVIDPLPYRIRLKKELSDPDVGVILLDVILGPACHPDPAGYLVSVLDDEGYSPETGPIIIASVCGTEADPQVATQQEMKLRRAGVEVFPSSVQAARFAGLILYSGPVGEALKQLYRQMPAMSDVVSGLKSSNGRSRIAFPNRLKLINIGLQSMGQAVKDQGAPVVQVDWRPPAGGNAHIVALLDRLSSRVDLVKQIRAANQKVYDTLIQGQPVWIDVAPAGQVVPGFRKNLILHTGPAIRMEDMIPAHRDGIIGGILYEGLAQTREEAVALVQSGAVEICPGIDWGVPSGGMAPTTFSMPVVVCQDTVSGTMGFCPIQEGPSYEALRWGVYNDVVAERWRWFRETLGPALSSALRSYGGLNLKNVIARSLQMGDENHSRELGSTLLIISELASHLSRLGLPEKDLARVFEFLHSAERFALHVHIAGACAVLRAAENISMSTVVVGMGGNGVELGIKISGLGDTWFTAAAPYIQGRYLNPNWTVEDTVPFAGDSCMVEVYGLGGLAAAASPAVTLLAGGTVEDALQRTRDMWGISVGKNPNYAIPALNFEGTPAGVDMLKVLESGVSPQSHAGIIHRQGGQAGAGVAQIPMACFEKAFLAFAEKIGLN